MARSRGCAVDCHHRVADASGAVRPVRHDAEREDSGVPITCHCTCGAKFGFPDHAAGKKARCKRCGEIFKVPSASNPARVASKRAARPAPVEAPVPPEAEPWDPLLGLTEGDAVDTGPAPGLLALAPEPVDDDTRHRSPPAEVGHMPHHDLGDAAPERSFWTDLPSAFVLPISSGGNFVTFIALCFVSCWTIPLGFAGVFGMAGLLLVTGYLCAFYLEVIRDAAAGEDDLPNVWISSVYDDLIRPLLQFIASAAVVALPGLLLLLYGFGSRTWELVPLAFVVMGVGGLFWPIVVLSMAIGGGMAPPLPHVIIRTALCAPLAYLAVLTALGVTVGLQYFAEFGLERYLSQGSGLLVTKAISLSVGVYTTIVAMRAIGLFYLHNKRKFPWVAE